MPVKEKQLTQVKLTPKVDNATVEILFKDTGVKALGITRRTTDGQEIAVRGCERLELSDGQAFVIDDEAPFGVTLTYCFYDLAAGTYPDVYDPYYSDDGASDGQTIITTETTLLAVTDCWIKVPGEVGMSTKVTVADHDRTDTFTIPTGIFPIVGTPYPIVIAGTISARSTSVAFITGTPAEAIRLHRSLTEAPVFLLLTPDGFAIAYGYFSPTSLTRSQRSRTTGVDASTFTVGMVEVERPVEGGSAGISWSRVTDKYATWDHLVLDVATWLALLQGF